MHCTNRCAQQSCVAILAGPSADALAAAREEGYSAAAAELYPKIEGTRAEAYEQGKLEAEEQGEAEMNDLLVCLGQEGAFHAQSASPAPLFPP